MYVVYDMMQIIPENLYKLYEKNNNVIKILIQINYYYNKLISYIK